MESIIVFDVETTGTDPERDQIIELSIQYGLDSNSEHQSWRVKPQVAISPAAQRIHGISADDLKDCPEFSKLSAKIRSEFEKAAVIVGYNLEFDLSFLQAEFQRLKEPLLDLKGKFLLDPYLIWRKFEPRSLSDAHRRFVGQDFDNSHSAAADVQATARVLQGMVNAFGLTGQSWPAIAKMCSLPRTKWIGPTYHFQWKDRVVVFGFGKHKNRSLVEVAAEEKGSYIDWLTKSDFPEHVKKIASNAAKKDEEELAKWAEQEFGG